MNTTLAITEARKKIFDIANDVQGGLHYTLTQHGKPKAVIMSAEEFDSWQETLEVMRDFPDLGKDIAEAEKDYKNGDYTTLEDLLAENGLSITKVEEHAVSSSRTKRGQKTVR